jgi:hypothetical protein
MIGRAVPSGCRKRRYLTILITRMNPDLAMDTADQKLLREHRRRQPLHGLRRA